MRPFRHCIQTQCFLALIIFNIFVLNPDARSDEALPDAQESHPGLGAESRFDEAIVAYHKKQTDQALSILDELLKADPDHVEYLEMKALTLKSSRSPQKSLEVYQHLYEITPPANQGPYAFELGTLLADLGKTDEAKPYFDKSIELEFNVVPSRFYLGVREFQKSNYEEAEKNFRSVAESKIEPFPVLGKYYLGVTYFKLNHGSQGVQQLVAVKRLTRDAKKGDVTKSIHDATDKMLDPFKHNQWFGSLLLQSQYDTNIQQLPVGFSNPTGSNNPATLKMNFSGGGGFMTAPLNTIQWVAGYRASYNYDFNRSTKGFEYFTNNASIYANYHSLEQTSAGLKLESSFAFQNTLADPLNPQGAYQYQKYNFVIGGGPYFHHQINRDWRFEAEAGLHKQTFYGLTGLSGNDYSARVTARSDLGKSYFNPGASVLFENNRTEAEQFFYQSYGLELVNSMVLSGAVTLLQTFDFISTGYTHSAPSRGDKNYSLRVSAVKLFSRKLSVLIDAAYIKNVSSIAAAYSYNQFLTSMGVGYTF